MYGKILLLLYAVILFCCGPSARAVGRPAEDCTSGFMSIDRIEAAVQGGPESEDHVLGNVVPSSRSISRQVILPYTNFTCNGSILSWTIGAWWEGSSPRYSELQIWRSSGDGSYTKVGSTTIMLEEEDPTQLYQYTLTSPLPFQAGDILDYFQGTRSTSRLLFEGVESNYPLHQNRQDSPSSQFIIGSETRTFEGFHLLIGVETNLAGCDCTSGFMSLERMRILLGLETVGDRFFTDQRQQITPDIKVTCNGLITKWTVGADWDIRDSLYPELQVWRGTGNDTYHKINSTVINITSRSTTRIYEYDTSIPVLAGDILGAFLPETGNSKLRLWSERDNGPIVYYVDTGSATESPVDAIDLQRMPSLSSTLYLPLVTVKIVPTVASNPTSSVSLMVTSFLSTPSTVLVNDKSSTPIFLPPEPVTTPPTSATQHELTTTFAASTTSHPHMENVSLFVGVGVACTLLVLITAAVTIITVLVCLRKKTNKLNITDNVAYQPSTSEVKLSPNAAYNAVSDRSPTSHDQEYVYVTTAAMGANRTTSIKAHEATNPPNTTDEAFSIPISTNEITTSTNQAYGVPTSTDGVHNTPTSTNSAYIATDIPTSTNQAYEATEYQSGSDVITYEAYYMSTTPDRVHDVSASTNAAREITTSTNPAYVATDVSTTTNQAYEAIQCPSGIDAITYDYIISH